VNKVSQKTHWWRPVRSLQAAVCTGVRAALIGGLLLVSSTVGAASSESAADVVRRATDKVLTAVSSDQTLSSDQDRLYRFVYDLVLPHFDFGRMSRRVLGKNWRKATPDQQTAFVDAFRALVVRTYATAIAGYKNQTVSIEPGRVDGEQATVKMDVTRDGGPPIPIVYTMGLVADQWKVYDVAIDGVSLVITYRTTFSTEVRRSGMDGLIKRLNDHTGAGA